MDFSGVDHEAWTEQNVTAQFVGGVVSPMMLRPVS